jgi:hypothetical protein
MGDIDEVRFVKTENEEDDDFEGHVKNVRLEAEDIAAGGESDDDFEGHVQNAPGVKNVKNVKNDAAK